MRRVFSIATFLAFAIAAAWASDVTGKWTGQMAGPDGSGMSVSCDLKQDGAKLTGTMDGPGGAMEIKDGKVDGEKISFTVAFNDMQITHEGAVHGDEITLTIKMEGGPGGEPFSITLKRSK